MRLWHYKLIPHLPRQQLLGQHRECCALRGCGWGKSHSVVNYVFKHPYGVLFNYHKLIMQEMVNRGYIVSHEWYDPCYRGKIIGYQISPFTNIVDLKYSEHNNDYLKECILNLKNKGIEIGHLLL